MSAMFQIAGEISNPTMGLINTLSLRAKKLTASKNDGVAKYGNNVTASRIAARFSNSISTSHGQLSI